MSSKSKTDTATTGTVTEAPTKPKFVFAEYQDNTGPVDTSRIDDIISDDYSHDEWQAAWIRYDQLDKALRRYYQVVRRDSHLHLFREDAFCPTHNVIGRGKEHMNITMGGIPEVYLCIRPREAEFAEQEQMSQASARRLESNDKLNAIKEKVGNVVGANMFGGVSMGHTSGWGKD